MSKEKQIEEMAQAIFDSGVVIDGFDRAFRSVTGKDLPDSRFLKMAAHLHDAGYRKQSEGEWVYGEYDIPHCSECGFEPAEISPCCPHCGAKMEGGAECT